jgi:hypothetical protein
VQQWLEHAATSQGGCKRTACMRYEHELGQSTKFNSCAYRMPMQPLQTCTLLAGWQQQLLLLVAVLTGVLQQWQEQGVAAQMSARLLHHQSGHRAITTDT